MGVLPVSRDETVVGHSKVKHLKRQVQELERLLGRKTTENEILKQALDKASQKKRISRWPLLPKEPGP